MPANNLRGAPRKNMLRQCQDSNGFIGSASDFISHYHLPKSCIQVAFSRAFKNGVCKTSGFYIVPYHGESIDFDKVIRSCMSKVVPHSSSEDNANSTRVISYPYAVLHKSSDDAPDLSSPTSELISARSIKGYQERKNHDYYLSSLGPIQPTFVKSLLKDVFALSKTCTQWCVENNQPRSIINWLKKHSPEFKEFTESSAYKHLIGSTLRSGVSYASKIQKKTNRAYGGRLSVRFKQSYLRALSLCESYNVIPLFSEDDWFGAHYSGRGPVPHYNVKCKVCNTTYDTYFHSSSIRVCPKCKEGSWHSARESQFKSWLESLGVTVQQSVRTLIKSPQGHPMELDLYLPDYHVAIEFNGYYFHSIQEHPKDYHVYKTEECLKRGISLFHFWEFDKDSFIKKVLFSIINNKALFNESSSSVSISRDICPSPAWFLKNNSDYVLDSYRESPWLFLKNSSFEYKSHTLVKHFTDPTPYLSKGFVFIYNTGTYVFQRVIS